MRIVRHVAAAVVSLVPAAGFAVAVWMLGPRLGPQIATHWGAASARPNGFSATWGSIFWGSAVATGALAVAALAAVIASAIRQARAARGVAAVTSGVSAIAASTWITGAWATGAAASPGEATLGARMLLLIGAPMVGVAVVALLPAGLRAPEAAPRRPYLALHRTERATWTQVITSKLLGSIALGTGALTAAFIAMAVASPDGTAVVLAAVFALALVATVALVPVRLTVDGRGIRLVSVMLRIPIIRIRLANIRDVSVQTVRASEWGGWGYRVSGAGIAYVTRSGPGIVITRRSGSRVAITVDEPEGPAGVANGLLRRDESSPRS